MSELTFQIEKIAGQAGENAECGLINKKIALADGEVGHLVGCLLVYDLDDTKRQEAIRDILEIAEKRLEGAEGSVLDVLKAIIESSERYLQEQSVDDASFLITFFYKNVCYIARHGENVKLVIFEQDQKSEIDFESGSGPVAAGQTYLIATAKFLELFNEGTFNREEIELSEIIDGLATELSANENQAEIGAVFIRTGGTEQVELDGDGREDVMESGEEGQGFGEVQAQEDVQQEELRGEEPVEDFGARESIRVDDDADGGESGQRIGTPLTDRIRLAISSMMGEVSKIRKGDGGATLRLRRRILACVVLIVLGLGIFGGYSIYQKGQSAKQAELEGYLDSARQKLNEGSALIELNKQRAREILVEAQKQAGLAKGINDKDPEVLKLISEIDSKLKGTEQTASINFSTFAELESDVQSLSFNGNKIEAFGQEKIYELDSKGQVIQDYEGISSVKSASVYDNKAFVLTDTAVERLDFANGKISQITDSATALDIGVFFGNVYLLGDTQISKYVPIEGGYSEPRDYLEKQEEFGSSSKMAIDSLVWVTRGNRILKFNKGVNEGFEISGMPAGGSDFGLIFTDSSLDNLYVLDRTNSVVLVIDKNGEYKQALSSGEFGKANDILVNDAEDTIYVAVGSKILSTSLGK